MYLYLELAQKVSEAFVYLRIHTVVLCHCYKLLISINEFYSLQESLRQRKLCRRNMLKFGIKFLSIKAYYKNLMTCAMAMFDYDGK